MGQEESVYGLPHTIGTIHIHIRPIGVLLGINKGIGRCNLAGIVQEKGYISHPCNCRVPIKWTPTRPRLFGNAKEDLKRARKG